MIFGPVADVSGNFPTAVRHDEEVFPPHQETVLKHQIRRAQCKRHT